MGHREAGRPRIYSDEAIFAAVDRILCQEGYPHLTLEAIALDVGCTRQALVRRFGSKHALLLAYLDAKVDRIADDYAERHAPSASPLNALYARFALPPDLPVATSIAMGARELAFVLAGSGDPIYAERFAALNRMQMQVIAGLLQAAIDEGELKPIDTALVARILYDTWAGEIITWCVDPTIDFAPAFADSLELVLGPHRLADNPL